MKKLFKNANKYLNLRKIALLSLIVKLYKIKEKYKMEVNIIPEESMVTADYKTNSIRIFLYKDNLIKSVDLG